MNVCLCLLSLSVYIRPCLFMFAPVSSRFTLCLPVFCVSTCVPVSVCPYPRVRLSLYLSMFLGMRGCLPQSVCMSVPTRLFTYVPMFACLCVCLCVCAGVCLSLSVCLCCVTPHDRLGRSEAPDREHASSRLLHQGSRRHSGQASRA